MKLEQSEKNKLIEERNELKKRLKQIYKILNNCNACEYVKKEENKYYCDVCDCKISKYSIKIHNISKKHNDNVENKKKEIDNNNVDNIIVIN